MQAITPWEMLPSLPQNEIGTSEVDPFRSSILGTCDPINLTRTAPSPAPLPDASTAAAIGRITTKPSSQRSRFKQRLADPSRHWKISESEIAVQGPLMPICCAR
jgi:hypothetical protein